MKEICKNYDKECRENGKTTPPDEIVERMAAIYHTRLLGWLHLRNTSDLAMQCIPEVEKVKSEADILLHIVFSEDNISEIKTKIKQILQDGKIMPDEQSDFEKIQQQARNIIARLFSVAAYEPDFKSWR